MQYAPTATGLQDRNYQGKSSRNVSLEHISHLNAEAATWQGAIKFAEDARVGQILDLGREKKAVVEKAMLQTKVDGCAAGYPPLICRHFEVVEIFLHKR